jgi:hypothetical protein
MRHLVITALAAVLGVGMLVTSPNVAQAQSKAPPGGAYQAVSKLVPLPDFLPGLGQLFVDPATLPAGPFLAYDHQGHLVSSIYMIPLKDMNAKKGFTNLKAAHANVDHVDIVYNAGHPGVAEPHYHMIVWYVSPARAAQLSK